MGLEGVLIEEIKKSAQSTSSEDMADAVHGLKGALRNFATGNFLEYLQELENKCDDGANISEQDLQKIEDRLMAVKEKFD